CAGIRTVRSDPAQVLVDQVLELRPPALEAGGRHVGDVVRDDLDVGLLRLHPGAGDVERSHVCLFQLRNRERGYPAEGSSLSIADCWRSDSAWMNCATNWNWRTSFIIRVTSSTGCTLAPSTAPWTTPGAPTGVVPESARNSVSPSA